MDADSELPEAFIKALAGNEAAVRNLTDNNLAKLFMFDHVANSHMDDVVRFFGEKGDEFLRVYESFGSSVYEPLRVLGSDVIVDLERYGDRFLDLFAAYSDDLPGLYREYGSRAIEAGISYGDNLFIGIATYGDEISGGNGYGLKETANPDFLIEGKVFERYAAQAETKPQTIIK